VDDDNVIDFHEAKEGIDGTTTLIPRRSGSYCPHASVYIGEDDRSLQCQACGADVDWHKFLLSFANGHRRLKATKDELAATASRLAELRREEKNTKARLRRARRQLAAVESKLGPKR
jgi:hypothetical protein